MAVIQMLANGHSCYSVLRLRTVLVYWPFARSAVEIFGSTPRTWVNLIVRAMASAADLDPGNPLSSRRGELVLDVPAVSPSLFHLD